VCARAEGCGSSLRVSVLLRGVPDLAVGRQRLLTGVGASRFLNDDDVGAAGEQPGRVGRPQAVNVCAGDTALWPGNNGGRLT
jgi:hypothetical protein